MDDSFDFGTKKIKTEGELEVTGVSRSGRVRKKSSKLTDFENLDELDMRSPKIKKEKPDFSTPIPRPIKKEKIQIKEEPISDEEEPDMGGFTMKPDQIFIKEEPLSDFESESDMAYQQHDDSSIDSLGSDIDDMDDADVERDDIEGFQPIAGDAMDDSPSQSQSVYMSEKSNKKKLVITDGKVVGRMKAYRKDKGTTRFTAYMLWAKEIRSELVKHNPDLDFSQTSKKLGELWATVPFTEKYIWKRRAKRLAARGRSKLIQQQTYQIQQQHMNASAQEPVKKIKSPPAPRKYVNKHTIISSPPAIAAPSEVKSSKQQQVVATTVAADSVGFKPVGTTPLDVAAHLRLLGESLTIIGERLTEHEGQITVWGSFSVLLDSLLCALGPLMCLTQQVPQLNVIPQEQLSQLMDSISYIMPGL